MCDQKMHKKLQSSFLLEHPPWLPLKWLLLGLPLGLPSLPYWVFNPTPIAYTGGRLVCRAYADVITIFSCIDRFPFCMGLRCNKKRIGPRTDPWDIPQDIVVRSAFMPLTETNCWRLLRIEAKVLSYAPYPIKISFFNNNNMIYKIKCLTKV